MHQFSHCKQRILRLL